MRLKELRKLNKLTQDEVAKTLNVSRATYNGYELGKYEPNIESLCILAKLYNVSVDELIGYDNKIDNSKSKVGNIINQLNNMSDKQLTALSQFIEAINDKG